MFTRDRVSKEKQEYEKNPNSAPNNLTDRREGEEDFNSSLGPISLIGTESILVVVISFIKHDKKWKSNVVKCNKLA